VLRCAFEKAQERTERAVREEVAQSRDELGKPKNLVDDDSESIENDETEDEQRLFEPLSVEHGR